MRRLLTSRLSHDLLTSLLLVALAFRALVPVGFMPSSTHPFSLEICHAGTLAPDHSTTPDHSTHFEHCPFGSAPGAGPLPDLDRIAQAPPVIPFFSAPVALRRISGRLERAHAARAPPTLA